MAHSRIVINDMVGVEVAGEYARINKMVTCGGGNLQADLKWMHGILPHAGRSRAIMLSP